MLKQGQADPHRSEVGLGLHEDLVISYRTALELSQVMAGNYGVLAEL